MARAPVRPAPPVGAARRRARPPVVALVVVVAAALLAAGCSRPERRDDATPTPTSPSTRSVPTGATGATGPPATSPVAAVRPAVPPTGTTVDGVLTTPDGRERTHHLYVPPNLPPGEQVPLLVALHGGTGWGTQFERNSGFDGLAEANGFIVVYPDGIGAGPGGSALRTWNGGYCCGPAARDGVDDVDYVRRLVDALAAEQPIDPDRVFVTGHSNGAILGYRLACELADRIAAVAVQAGSLGVDDCRPARPVPLLHLHGTADRNHPIEGGRGDGISGTDFHPAIDGVRTIAAADGCPPEGTAVRRSDDPDVTVTTWAPCRDGAEVQLVTVEGASHAWMGHEALAPRMTGEAYPDLDASAEVWAFLAAHPRRAG